jgi:hypothetical protein
MILLLHILIAVSTIVLSVVSFFRPSNKKIISTYIMTGLTVLTGGSLIVILHASILHTCITGLAELTVVSLATVLARRKLIATE